MRRLHHDVLAIVTADTAAICFIEIELNYEDVFSLAAFD